MAMGLTTAGEASNAGRVTRSTCSGPGNHRTDAEEVSRRARQAARVPREAKARGPSTPFPAHPHGSRCGDLSELGLSVLWHSPVRTCLVAARSQPVADRDFGPAPGGWTVP